MKKNVVEANKSLRLKKERGETAENKYGYILQTSKIDFQSHSDDPCCFVWFILC
jgi:hypothetical protein